MILQKMLHLMTKHSDEMAQAWIHDVRQNLDTLAFKNLSDEKIRQAVLDVFTDTARWLKDPGGDIGWVEETYTKTGTNFQKTGFPISEAVKAWILIKHHMWSFVQQEGVFDSATDMYQALELLRDIGNFFDHVIYHLVHGYEREASVEAWKKS